MVSFIEIIFRKEEYLLAGRKKATATEKIRCTKCGRELSSTQFYNSYSILNEADKKLHICKSCLWALCEEYTKEKENVKVGVFRICRLLDIPYLETPFQAAIEESQKMGQDNGVSAFKIYMKNINSLKQYTSYTFETGDSIDNYKKENEEQQIEKDLTERDKENEAYCIRILGYDPFENENKKDRKFLFNRLVDMLDDSTLEDNIKLMSVISIVKGFNQVEYIDQAIALLTSDIAKLNKNNGGIKSLIDTKKNLMATIYKAAEDNGISFKYNTNKSVGAGTLTGTMKKLIEIGLDEVEVNLFDIQTAKGMKQVADLSNQSIVEQLQFDENEYTDMIAYQRNEMNTLRSAKEKFEEEARKLKIENAKLQKQLKDKGGR